MTLSDAPLFTDVAPGPAGGTAHWTETSDCKRIRVAHWPAPEPQGTVLLFPGRTEYIEKYGSCAAELAARGLFTLAVDWRGQGLADRLLPDRAVGHVDFFSDYQKDVAAVLRAARELALPRPYFLLAHSMGGAIGLRAVMEGLPVQSAAFSAPMWGIHIAPHMRIVAGALSRIMPRIGRGGLMPPGSYAEAYVLAEPFENNMLTTDPAMYEMMRDQIRAHPELSLGGPSFVWLREALAETAHLAARGAPALPCVSWLGTNERIVDKNRIHKRMARWTNGNLQMVEGAEHEVLMEIESLRRPIFDGIRDLFLGTARRG